MNLFARRLLRTRVLLASVGALVATVGCDKAREEPVPAPATVVMPGAAAPTDTSATVPASTPAMASSGRSTDDSTLPAAANADASGRITAGNNGPLTGGTLSVIPNATPTPITTTPSTGNTGPLDAAVLPPGLSARPPGPGAIGPDPSASSSADDQPPSVPPGSKR